MRCRLLVYVNLLLLLATSSCSQKEAPTHDTTSEPDIQTKQVNDAPQYSLTANALWLKGQVALDNALQSADTLATVTQTLLSKPTDKHLRTAQTAWHNLADKLQTFFVYTHLSSLAPKQYGALASHHFNIAAWPVQPGFLDGFGPYPFSGIVNDVGIPLTLDTLRAQHGMTDDSDVSLGTYAIEFLLFGERNLRGHLTLRKVSALGEEMKKRGYTSAAELPFNRRRALLALQTDALIQDLNLLAQYWQQGPYGDINIADKNATLELLLLEETLVSHARDIESQRKDPLLSTTELKNWKTSQLAQRLQGQTQGMASLISDQNSLLAKAITNLDKSYAALANTQTGKEDWKDVALALQNVSAALSAKNPMP